MGELAGTPAVLRHLVTNGRDRSAGPSIAHAAFPVLDYGRGLRAGLAGVATQGSREIGKSGELKTELGQMGQAGASEELASD